MSEELKTLKDMETKSVVLEGFCIDETQENIVESYELRQEAIKWIKKMQKINDNNPMKLPNGEWLGSTNDFNNYDGAIVILMAFFNIKDEDLK